jgi:hypothetical protein
LALNQSHMLLLVVTFPDPSKTLQWITLIESILWILLLHLGPRGTT